MRGRDVLTVSEGAGSVFTSNSVDLMYKSLRSSLAVVEPGTDEYGDATAALGSAADRARVCNVFRVVHPVDTARYAPPGGESRLLLHGSRTSNFVGILTRGLLPPRCQWLQTRSLEMLANTKEECYEDFLAYAVETRIVHDQHPNLPNQFIQVRQYKRDHRLILFEEEDTRSIVGYSDFTAKFILHDQCWYGLSMSSSKSCLPGPLFKRPAAPPDAPPDAPPFASELSIALGLFADPDQAEGCRWLVSLFKHYSGRYEPIDERRQGQIAESAPYPYWHRSGTPMWKLAMMGEMALAADDHLRSQAAAPRGSRGATAKAMRGLHRCASIDRRYESAPEDDDDSDYDARASEGAGDAPPRRVRRPRVTHLAGKVGALAAASAVDRLVELLGAASDDE